MIHYVSETGSTNAELTARLTGGEFIAEGEWLIADRQSHGRGRHGRAWCDGAGNFMGSTVVHTSSADPQPGSLALLAGIALHEVISARLPLPHRAVLKWPNDVLIADAKLAGILLERVHNAVVIGIGVNLASAPQLADRATIALSQYAPTADRNNFADELAAQFALELSRWRAYGLEPIIARWLAAGHPIGTGLQIGETGATPLSGSFAGLSQDGALQLRLPDDTLRVVHAGEVRLN